MPQIYNIPNTPIYSPLAGISELYGMYIKAKKDDADFAYKQSQDAILNAIKQGELGVQQQNAATHAASAASTDAHYQRADANAAAQAEATKQHYMRLDANTGRYQDGMVNYHNNTQALAERKYLAEVGLSNRIGQLMGSINLNQPRPTAPVGGQTTYTLPPYPVHPMLQAPATPTQGQGTTSVPQAPAMLPMR